MADQLTASRDGAAGHDAPRLTVRLDSFPHGGLAAVFGATGGIGAALGAALTDSGRFDRVLGFSRCGDLSFDLTDEASVATAAETLATCGDIRLVILATGMLHEGTALPEKSWRELDAERLARAFAINAIGPALLLKHLLPRLPRTGKAMVAALSARVGSIGSAQPACALRGHRARPPRSRSGLRRTASRHCRHPAVGAVRRDVGRRTGRGGAAPARRHRPARRQGLRRLL